MKRGSCYQALGRALAAALLLLPANLGVRAEESSGPLLDPDRIKTDLLFILAHPDDEGVIAPLLAREALEERRRVAGLYLTDGRFGTNRVGAVSGPAFGHLRMAELHWTLDRLGVAMFWTLGRSDRGGSPDPAAVLRSWDRERTVKELARFIRLLRPGTVITWFPGPASSHVDHAAAGGAALLACRAAARPESFPDQLAGEGLRPHQVERVYVVAQAEKVGYERFPGWLEESGGAAVETEELDVLSRTLGRRYTDIAREALREQRAVSAAANLGRGGPFDEPLRLIPLSPERGEEPPGDGLRIRLRSAQAQAFLEAIAGEVGAPQLTRVFLPEALVKPGGVTVVAWEIGNPGEARVALTVRLEPPPGWKVRPRRRRLELEPGGSGAIAFEVRAPLEEEGRYHVARLVVEGAGVGGETVSAGVVLRRASSSRSP